MPRHWNDGITVHIKRILRQRVIPLGEIEIYGVLESLETKNKERLED